MVEHLRAKTNISWCFALCDFSTFAVAGKSFTACDTCRGDGRVRKTKRIKLTVPAGVADGTRLRVTGEDEYAVQIHSPQNQTLAPKIKLKIW